MRPTSAAGAADESLNQYCITIEMQAAPHPLVCCRTKGTFSHKPGAAAPKHVAIVTKNAAKATMRGETPRCRNSGIGSAHCNHDNNYRRGNNDQSDLPLRQPAGREVLLSLISP